MHDAAALRRHVYFRGDMNEVFEKMAWSENWFSLNIMRLEAKLEQMQTFAVFRLLIEIVHVMENIT